GSPRQTPHTVLSSLSKRRQVSAKRSRSPAFSRRSHGSCVPRPASAASGSRRASPSKPWIFSRPSTAGSPKASTPPTSKTRRRCWASYPKLRGEVGMRPLGKLYPAHEHARAGGGASHHRDDDVARDVTYVDRGLFTRRCNHVSRDGRC